MSCIFCKIVDGEMPSNKVYEDDHVLAFHDIAPDAPVHVLVIPKQHVTSILELNTDTGHDATHLLSACQQIAHQLKVAETGFRLVVNTGKEGGQSVDHLHFHLLGGRGLSWPPG